MCQVDLKALNEKYPTCSTCAFRYERKPLKVVETWCSKHKRKVEFEWGVDAKGKRYTITDKPCDDYEYHDTATELVLFFRQLRSS